jgi:hypothetical protein
MRWMNLKLVTQMHVPQLNRLDLSNMPGISLTVGLTGRA